MDFNKISYKTNNTGKGSYTVSLVVFAATKSNYLPILKDKRIKSSNYHYIF
jgi:hypothetical protein